MTSHQREIRTLSFEFFYSFDFYFFRLCKDLFARIPLFDQVFHQVITFDLVTDVLHIKQTIQFKTSKLMQFPPLSASNTNQT